MTGSSTREDRRVATIALVVLAGAALVLGSSLWLGSCRQGGDEQRRWFDDLEGAEPIEDEQVAEITGWLRDRLLAGTFVAPPELADPWPRILFLTISDGSTPGVVFLSSGDGVTDAAERALALAAARQGERDWSLLKVDVVDQVGESQLVEPRGPLDFERGLEGVAFESRSGLAFLPEEVVVRTLVTSDNEIRAGNLDKYLRALGPSFDPLRSGDAEARSDELWSGGEATVRTFTTRSFFADSERVMPLYRGHRELRREQPDDLLSAAVAAGDYLRRAVEDDGSFVYSYLAKTDREKDEYNMLRHAGTAYSLLELYAVTGDPELLEAAERALGFLRRQIVECRPGSEWASCVEENGYVKLGGNALAILAFAEHARVTGDRSALPLMSRLASWLTGVQEPSGEFSIHKLELATAEIDDHISEYYPGEALFALTRLHELDGDATWLDAAQRGARWLIEVRDGDLADDELSHDHWLLYALNELHRQSPDPIVIEHALRLARVISSSQNRRPDFPDWRGSYYRPPRSTPTATRSEGLCAAYALATREGRNEEAAEILEAARLGVDFQLQLQFRPESTLYLPDPMRALGGFPRSLTDFGIRIDYVQHNLSSMLALRRLLLSAESTD